MVKIDDKHINFRYIDGYNADFNFIISGRESGKTTQTWLKLYNAFKNRNECSLVIRRRTCHITTAYIDDIAKIINKFTDDNVIFKYTASSMKDGIVDVKIDNKLFFRVIGLSGDITKFKSLMITNLRYIVFDEFIPNLKYKEKYLTDEVNKFKDIYNTFQRESNKLTCYFLGNPYSLFCPYFLEYGFNTNEIKLGCCLYNKNKSAVLWYYKLSDELIAYIKSKNSLFKEEDLYTGFSLFGENINDKNIKIVDNMPQGFQLNTVFYIENKYICFYKTTTYKDDFYYYVKFLEKNEVLSRKRDIYTFDLDDLQLNNVLLTNETRLILKNLRRSFEFGLIAFQNIECYYLSKEIYKSI